MPFNDISSCADQTTILDIKECYERNHQPSQWQNYGYGWGGGVEAQRIGRPNKLSWCRFDLMNAFSISLNELKNIGYYVFLFWKQILFGIGVTYSVPVYKIDRDRMCNNRSRVWKICLKRINQIKNIALFKNILIWGFLTYT